jgi:hypothetical protein
MDHGYGGSDLRLVGLREVMAERSRPVTFDLLVWSALHLWCMAWTIVAGDKLPTKRAPS